MKDTRYYDKAYIEEKMADGTYSRKRGLELLDEIHKQTKDSSTEDYRKKLIEQQKRYDRKYRQMRQEPEGLDKHELAKLIEYFNANPNEF